MLLVKEVKVIKTERNDWQEIYHMSAMPDYVKYREFPDIVLDEMQIKREMVEGRRFVNEHGEEVVIGWAIDVQETLGLPFEVFEHHSADSWKKHKENLETRKQLGFRESEINKLRGFIDAWRNTTEKLKDRLMRQTEISNRCLNLNFMERLKFLFFREIE